MPGTHFAKTYPCKGTASWEGHLAGSLPCSTLTHSTTVLYEESQVWGWTEYPRKIGRAQSIPHPLKGTLVHHPISKEMTSSYPSDRWWNTEAIHKAGRSRPEKKTSPNSWASNLSITYCFCLIWLKSAHSIFPIHDCEEGEHRKLKIQRSKPLPPGKSKNIGMQGQIILQLVPPNSSPALQELACSSRRSAPAFLVSTIWPSSPAVQPSPGES